MSRLPANKRWWLLAIILAVAASNFGRWVWAAIQPAPAASDYTLTLVDGAGRPLSAQPGPLKLMLDPFTIYRNAPGQTTAHYTIDTSGFRGGIDQDDRPLVFVVGGSSVFGQDLPSDAETLPEYLAGRMPEFRFVNAGTVGYLSGQELASIVHRLDRFRPVGYIVVDGWNELFDQYHFAHRPIDQLGFNNTFFDVENRLHDHHAQLSNTPALPRPEPPTVAHEEYLEAILATYHRHLDQMNSFVQSRQAFLFVVIQPELGNKRAPSEEEERALAAWDHAYGYRPRGFPQTYRQLINATISFAQDHGIGVVSANQDDDFNSAIETTFLDPVHLTGRGNERLAEMIARTIAPVLAK